ncbi:hypothetical protein OCU04_009151 [Sclerotinia nivalis]|uniref:WD40 repeat-like protein n=1 Tax=Sclerotinia nivalis TaxID=352851 RepID=A0A9X0DJ29_9HELO|nr:hypothetical protein OCU04_009151 [Sclerotinia nivalis]
MKVVDCITEKLYVWSLIPPALRLRHTLKKNLYKSNEVAFSANGKYFASAYSDIIELWSPVDWTLQTTLHLHSQVSSMLFSHDNKLLVFVSVEGVVQFWDVAVLVLQENLGFQSHSVNNVKFSPDGKLIVCSVSGGTLQLRDPTTWGLKQTLEYPCDSVLELSRYGDKFVVESSRTSFELWKREIYRNREGDGLDEDEDIRELLPSSHHMPCPTPGRLRAPVEVLAVSPNTRFVAICDAVFDQLRLFDTNTGAQAELHEEVPDSRGFDGSYLAFSPDSKILALGSGFGHIYLWDTTAALKTSHAHF